MKKNISILLGITVAALALIVSGCGKSCDIKVKNGFKGEISVHTKMPGSSGEPTENVLTLKPGEDIKIGECQDCAAINEEEITATAMLVSVGSDELELKDKKEIIKFLNDLRSDGCGVKVFE